MEASYQRLSASGPGATRRILTPARLRTGPRQHPTSGPRRRPAVHGDVFGFVETARPFPTVAIVDANNVMSATVRRPLAPAAARSLPAPTRRSLRPPLDWWRLDLHRRRTSTPCFRTAIQLAAALLDRERPDPGPDADRVNVQRSFGNGFCVIEGASCRRRAAYDLRSWRASQRAARWRWRPGLDAGRATWRSASRETRQSWRQQASPNRGSASRPAPPGAQARTARARSRTEVAAARATAPRNPAGRRAPRRRAARRATPAAAPPGQPAARVALGRRCLRSPAARARSRASRPRALTPGERWPLPTVGAAPRSFARLNDDRGAFGGLDATSGRSRGRRGAATNGAARTGPRTTGAGHELAADTVLATRASPPVE